RTALPDRRVQRRGPGAGLLNDELRCAARRQDATRGARPAEGPGRTGVPAPGRQPRQQSESLVDSAGSGLLPGPARLRQKAWFLPEAPPPAAAGHVYVPVARVVNDAGMVRGRDFRY